jgi:hypothetical protein
VQYLSLRILANDPEHPEAIFLTHATP